MTHIFKKQSTSMISSTTPSRPLGMHRDSRVISKVQPKIRIIHIFAPEIIKTDVANFRELVQRLTGKPSLENDAGGKGRGKGKKVKVQHDGAAAEAEAGIGCNKPTISTKLEVMMGSGSSSSPSSSSDHYNHQQHDDVWRSTAGDHNSSSGGFLTGFNDLDCFDFNTMFHTTDGSSHLNSLG